MLRTVHAAFLPHKVLLLADQGRGQKRLAERLEFIREVRMIDERATAYVCENYACQRPTHDTAEVARLLRRTGGRRD
jgi:hypothetical protein